MSTYKPLGGNLFTTSFMFFLIIFLIGFYFIVERFIFGIGAVSNLNGGYPWGIWIVYDVVIGTAFACGGYALALSVYVLNKGEYHPLVRPALLTSLLGYAMGGFGAFFDMGRWWQFYNILIPSNWNFNAALLEVALCIMLYMLVLFIEFSPVWLEKIGLKSLLKWLNKILFFFIALGILLPTMHQSSLGTMLVALGHKVHPLWQTMQFQPLLALISALSMGFSIVIFEESISSVGLNRTSETPLLRGLGKIIIGLLTTFLVIRFSLLLIQGNFSYLLNGDLASLLYLIETILFITPIIILLSPTAKISGPKLLIAALSMLLGGALYRLDAFLITFNPGPGYSYFPSVPEIMVTLGVISFEILVYMTLIKILPVLPHEKHA